MFRRALGELGDPVQQPGALMGDERAPGRVGGGAGGAFGGLVDLRRGHGVHGGEHPAGGRVDGLGRGTGAAAPHAGHERFVGYFGSRGPGHTGASWLDGVEWGLVWVRARNLRA